MAENKTLPQLPLLVIPTTGDIGYSINGAQSYKISNDSLARLFINEYGIFCNPLNPNLITASSAEVILNSLNLATVSKLNTSQINGIENFISGYFDIDGGTWYDTFANASTFDGGNF